MTNRRRWFLAALGLLALGACSSTSAPVAGSAGASDASDAGDAGGGVDAGANSEAAPPAVDAASTTDAVASPDVERPRDPCVEAGSCQPGVWVDVTPANVNLTSGACGNYGTKGVQVDPLRAEDVYVQFNCQGIWKSSDYGRTWNGPINTGQNGVGAGDCAGAIAIAHTDPSRPAILYQSCIRDDGSGDGFGFWRSTNAGVDWTRSWVLPPSWSEGDAATVVNQGFYTPTVDPYDADHLMMAAHETDALVESVDGGQTWTSVPMDPGMMLGDGSTGGVNFINTGAPATTRKTVLWISAGKAGTWRTADGGATWSHVESNEHVNGSMHSELYQPPAPYTGTLFMTGNYSTNGDGVFASSDFGVWWAHVGQAVPESIVIGTKTSLYAMYGWGGGVGVVTPPDLETSALPGTGAWSQPGTPAAMTQGPGQAAVTNDGTYDIVFAANYNAGLWRYVEPE